MSREIQVLFEIRSALILKDTLKEMGINYEELGNLITIKKKYHNIVMDLETGTISFDEMNINEVNKIKKNYMVNWYKDNAIREGNKVKEEINEKGQVILHVYHS